MSMNENISLIGRSSIINILNFMIELDFIVLREISIQIIIKILKDS